MIQFSKYKKTKSTEKNKPKLDNSDIKKVVKFEHFIYHENSVIISHHEFFGPLPEVSATNDLIFQKLLVFRFPNSSSENIILNIAKKNLLGLE